MKENGKTFQGTEPNFERVHDENYSGKLIRYKRCDVCKKLVSRQWQQYHNTLHENNPF